MRNSIIVNYVELHGCVGKMISLEHITFGPRLRTYLGGGRWLDVYNRLSHLTETGRNLIREEL